MTKSTKTEANYHESSPSSEYCKDCSMFRSLTRTCTAVKGLINPRGWCRYWEEK